MILVDTSAWIDFFRGRGRFAEAVDQLLESDDVAICGPIVTEIRRGLRSSTDRARVLPLLAACHHLEQPRSLWEEAGDLGTLLGKRGANVKSLDLLIATYALAHTVALLTADTDFARIRRAGVGLMLVEA
jgi:predicted nucleic acid-binding protein